MSKYKVKIKDIECGYSLQAWLEDRLRQSEDESDYAECVVGNLAAYLAWLTEKMLDAKIITTEEVARQVGTYLTEIEEITDVNQ